MPGLFVGRIAPAMLSFTQADGGAFSSVWSMLHPLLIPSSGKQLEHLQRGNPGRDHHHKKKARSPILHVPYLHYSPLQREPNKLGLVCQADVPAK